MNLILIALLFAGFPQEAVPPSAVPVKWIVGCWASGAGADGMREHWFRAGDDAIVGSGWRVKDGRLASYEFMIIRATPGGLTFTAKPSGQPETTFAAERVERDMVTFVNPAHDFPQRVIYRLLAEDQLLGRIEGQQDGRPRAVDFPMRRTRCH